MTTASIRKELHHYLETAEDEKVMAIYSFMENEIQEAGAEYSKEFKIELDQRYTDYAEGTANIITLTESKRRIAKILKDKSI